MEGKMASDYSSKDRVEGVILAGGSSKRYGKNKAFLEIGGVRLIDGLVSKMKEIFNNVAIVCNKKHLYEYLGVPVYEDIVKGLGPIGGLFTGLKKITGNSGFFIACDMPFINKDLIHYMIEIKGSHEAVIPLLENEVEPLFAVYSRSCLQPIKNLIDSECFKVRALYGQISVRYVTEKEINKFDSPGRLFININKPEDLAKIKPPVD